MLRFTPAVFAVEQEYQIMVPVVKNSLLWVKVGDKTYYDAQNGIMCSLSLVHRVHVPMEELDAAGGYTVCEKVIVDRKPYFPITEDTVETYFPFTPIPDDDVRIFHLADAHNQIEEPVASAKAFGKIDLLVFNGDMLNNSGAPEKFYLIYEIADAITKGSIPIVFSRGNHDLRGYYAEAFADFTPNRNGYTYYTFRLKQLWGLVLDCGEDKWDNHEEYGYTVACESFREEETKWLKAVACRAQNESRAEGVKNRVVICHRPLHTHNGYPFDVGEDHYAEWLRIISDYFKPDVMLCGHEHDAKVYYPGDKWDVYGAPCPVIVAAHQRHKLYRGCGIVMGSDTLTYQFVSQYGYKHSLVNLKEPHQMKEKYDVLVIGPVSLDHNIDYEGNERKELGGAVVASGFAAAKSGYKTALFTKLNSKDANVEERFANSGAKLFWKESKATCSIKNQYFTANKEKRACTSMGVCDAFTFEELPEIEPAIYHFAGLVYGDFDGELFAKASEKGKVAVDVQCLLRHVEADKTMAFHDWADKEKYLPYIDYLKTDAAEAEVLTGTTDRVEAAKMLYNWGAKEVVISHNTEVLAYAGGDKFFTCPIKARNLSGRTGRGDTIFAGYINERSRAGMAEALLYATALVSLKMETPGPFTGTREDVLAYIDEFYKEEKAALNQ